MAEVAFVTSVYDELYQTEFAGRSNRGTHYAFSLAQIHSTGVPVYCYTDQYNIMKFMPALRAHGHTNTRFFNYDLKDFPLHKEIVEIKNSDLDLYANNAWQQRCVEIMWGKFDMIVHAAETMGIGPNKYLFWVDAGLSHEGILPHYYNSTFEEGKYTPASFDYQHRFYYDRIFNENLPQYLIDYMAGNQLLFCFCTMPQHNDPSPLPERKEKGTSVGGLFGGDVETIYKWAKRGQEVYKYLVNEKCLIKEEDILSHLIDQNTEDSVKLYRFNTWYHEDWGTNLFSRERGQESFADLFQGVL